MKLSEIEVGVPIGRTLQGHTITVIDVLRAFATVTGTRVGSLEFDQVLSDPAQLHATDMLGDAAHYRLLRTLLVEAEKPGFLLPEHQPLQALTIERNAGEADQMRLSVTLKAEPGVTAAEAVTAALVHLLAKN